jgi:hypothetical protein
MPWQELSTFGSAALYSAANVALLDQIGTTLQPTNILPADKVALPGVGLIGTSVSFFTSYEIAVLATAGSAGSQGFVQIILQWFNLATDVQPIDEVIWYIPANQTGALTVGHGPNRGNFLAVQAAAVEVATTPLTTLTQFSLTGSQRPGSDHNWYSAALPQEGIASASSARAYTSELVVVSAGSVAGPGSLLRYCFMQAGKAHLHAENRSANGICTVDLTDAPFGLATLLHSSLPQNGTVDIDLILPRMGTVMTVANTGAAAGTIYVTLVGDRV